MDIKYIVFRSRSEYGWVSHLELNDYDDVLLDKDIHNKFLFHLNRFCTAAKINKYISIPFQSFWFKYYIDESSLRPEEEYIFLFEEGSRPYLIKEYLLYLKRKYFKSHIVFAAFNSSFQYPQNRLEFIEKYYDYITSFDRKDCLSRGWGLYTGIYSRIKVFSTNGNYDSDVFFVGVDKGRLSILYDIYDRLTSAGLICDFYVTGVKEGDIRKGYNIHFNEWMKYEDVLKKCSRTRCLLEVLQPGQDGETYRQGEAVAYGIKLLTNYQNVIKERYYNPKQISVFSSAEDIDVSFIKEEYTPQAFPYNGCLSPYKRLQWLSEQLRNK